MASFQEKKIILQIAGLGIIFHSPKSAEHIAEGEDYFASNYQTPEQVQSHIQKGTIVGFCTGPGDYILNIRYGYPSVADLDRYEFKLRLGLHCIGGLVCFRDLYELMEWSKECPADRTVTLADGFYHITLCTNTPASGILGDNQTIEIYFHKLDAFPKLADLGVPQLW